MRKMHQLAACAVVSLGVMLASGCRKDAPEPRGVSAAEAAITSQPSDALRVRAQEALDANRHFAPAGNNAAEALLELRDRGRADAGDLAAITEMQPYLIIAAERAVEGGNAPEAERLVRLLARMDPNAPALARLNAAVADTQAAVADSDTRSPESQTTAPAARPVTSALRPSAVAAQGSSVSGTGPSMIANSSSEHPPAAAPPQNAPAAVASSPPEPVAPGRAAAEPRAAAAPALRLVQDVQPSYPTRALARRLEGRVEVMFTVQPDGSVENVRVIQSTHARMFDQAALAAARRWRFAPIPTAATTTRTLQFAPPTG